MLIGKFASKFLSFGFITLICASQSFAAPTIKKAKGDTKPMSATTTPAPTAEIVHVKLHTSMGDIKIELYHDKAPLTVNNFVEYVKAGQYDKTIFHRVIDKFMIQGGGMDEKMKEKSTRAPVKNEGKNGLKNDKGTIAMARTNDPDSATAQFFINTSNNDFLNANGSQAGYAVFGKVIEGMDVIDLISKVKTGNAGPHSDVPVKQIVIESAKIEK